jgi:hypothetical protein
MHAVLGALLHNAPAALKTIGAILSSREAAVLVRGSARFAKRHPVISVAAGVAVIYAFTANRARTRYYAGRMHH